MNKYHFIPLSLLLCFLCSGCFATDSSVKKMEERISVMEKDMAQLKIANDKLNEKLTLEEKEKKETEAKLGKQIETLKKDQEKLKTQVKFFEREIYLFSRKNTGHDEGAVYDGGGYYNGGGNELSNW